MSLRVIGAGLGRTGTHSLKLALEQLLAGPCYHMVEVFPRPEHVATWSAAARGEDVDWRRLFDGFVATVDWPSSAFWWELAQAFPDAPILLSTRDTASWWKSASATIFAEENRAGGAHREMIDALLASRFTSDRTDERRAVAAYEKHYADVRARAPRSRLVEWTTSDGWGPLCAMLGVPVPQAPFPRTNSTDEFRARVAARTPPDAR